MFLVYTTEEGGTYHVTRCSRDEFERIRETGQVQIMLDANDGPTILVEPVYIALLGVVEDNYDFIVEDSRDDTHPIS